MLPDFKLHYKAPIIKTILYSEQNSHTDHYNRIKSLEIYPHEYKQLIFDKEAKTYTGEKRISPLHSAGKIGKPHAKEWN